MLKGMLNFVIFLCNFVREYGKIYDVWVEFPRECFSWRIIYENHYQRFRRIGALLSD